MKNLGGDNEYQCAHCGNVYYKGRSDEQAVAESESKFGMAVAEETHAVICDDCFQRIFNQ